MRVGLIGQTRRGWASVGVKVVQAVEYTYQWQYLALAVNGVNGRLWWDWRSGMTSQALAGCVPQWEKRGVSAVVWDRARGHGPPPPARSPRQVRRVRRNARRRSDRAYRML